VIDLVKQPHLAKGDQILAVPTVVRKLPKPVRTIIGNLSDTDRVLVGLDCARRINGTYAGENNTKPKPDRRSAAFRIHVENRWLRFVLVLVLVLDLQLFSRTRTRTRRMTIPD